MQLEGTIAALLKQLPQKLARVLCCQALLKMEIQAETKGVEAGRNVVLTDQNTNTGIEHN